MLGPVTMTTGIGSVPSGRAGYNTAGLPENVTMATMAIGVSANPLVAMVTDGGGYTLRG